MADPHDQSRRRLEERRADAFTDERLSAFADGELAGEDANAFVARLLDDDALRERWNAYHLIGDALRGTAAAPIPRAAFAARLAAEPAIIARPKPVLAPKRQAERMRLSAFAGVAAVAFVGWVAMPNLVGGDTSAPALSAASVKSSAGIPVQPALVSAPASGAIPVSVVATVPASAPVPAAAMPALLEDYLLAHQRYSVSSQMQGAVPYVRVMVPRPAVLAAPK